MRRRPSTRSIGAVIMLGVSAAGCTPWVSIKPTELPKVMAPRDPSSVVATDGREPRWMGFAERPSGDLVPIAPHSDVRLTLPYTVRVYEHPVRATLSGGVLTIAGRNRPEESIPLSEVRRAEAFEASGPSADSPLAVLLWPVLAVGAGALGVFIVFGVAAAQ
jgi:hypothetical protein